LPLGRIIEERYRQAGVKYKAHDNHVIVTQLIEEENNLDLRLPGFVAPSKYGANPNYIRPEEYVEDKYGRIKPWPYQQNYQPPTAKLKESLTEIAQSLTDFMAYVNYVSLEEAYMLGEKMGLQKKLLKEVVKWSCGTSWVFDNEDSFSPDRSILKKIKDYHFSEKARIATVEKILSVL
jgi:3-hydroxyisobutyrate dehydrogenase